MSGDSDTISDIALMCLSPLLALNGHPTCTDECPLLGGKADMPRAVMSANDLERTFNDFICDANWAVNVSY